MIGTEPSWELVPAAGLWIDAVVLDDGYPSSVYAIGITEHTVTLHYSACPSDCVTYSHEARVAVVVAA